jgi:hypothetical protein
VAYLYAKLKGELWIKKNMQFFAGGNAFNNIIQIHAKDLSYHEKIMKYM